MGLTGGRVGRIVQRREPAARSCGGHGRRSRRRVLRGSSWPLGGTGRLEVLLWGLTRVRGASKSPATRKLQGRRCSPGAGPGGKSRAAAEQWDAKGGRRCSWFHEGGPAAASGGWEAVAWPVRGGAGERQGRAAWRRRLGLEAALARGMGSWGSAGGLKGDGRRSRGPAREGRPRWFRPEISAGPLGAR